MPAHVWRKSCGWQAVDEAKPELQPGGMNSKPGKRVTWHSELKPQSVRHKNEVLQMTSG